MKNLLIISALVLLASCSTNYKYSSVSHVNNMQLKDIDFSKEFKTGRACAQEQGPLNYDGTNSIVDAAKSANIKTVVFVDKLVKKQFLAKPEICVLVYGY